MPSSRFNTLLATKLHAGSPIWWDHIAAAPSLGRSEQEDTSEIWEVAGPLPPGMKHPEKKHFSSHNYICKALLPYPESGSKWLRENT